MLTIGLYFFNMLVLLVLATKSLFVYRRVRSNFIAKRFVQIGFTTTIVYLSSIASLLFYYTGRLQYSNYASVITMIALYVSLLATAGFIRDLTHAIIPVRILKATLALAGIFMVVSTLVIPNTTAVDANGIAVSPPALTIQSAVYALSVLVTYNWSSVAMIWAGIRNPRTRTKLFLLGSGFLLGTWSAAGLVLARDVPSTLIVYSLFFFSYVLQLLGIFEPSEG